MHFSQQVNQGMWMLFVQFDEFRAKEEVTKRLQSCNFFTFWGLESKKGYKNIVQPYNFLRLFFTNNLFQAIFGSKIAHLPLLNPLL